LSFDGDQYPSGVSKVITTRGDIIRGNSSGDRERYGIGASATVLTSDGTDPAWAAAGGLTINTLTDHITADFTDSSTVFITTGIAITLSNETDGNAIIIASGQWKNTTGGADTLGVLTDDDVEITDSSRLAQMSTLGNGQGYSSATNMDTDGSVIDFRAKCSSGQFRLLGSGGTPYVCAIIATEFY